MQVKSHGLPGRLSLFQQVLIKQKWFNICGFSVHFFITLCYVYLFVFFLFLLFFMGVSPGRSKKGLGVRK